ncbi:TetR/AcrR family transcriptional regulator [Lentibacillus cibarius]|uniref:TetR/AcrR family transcriptional regulator n=1 Tax=Lentibacillus cibarius TaxID=2583219 RepID=A0A549YFI3_9BACI|nr:TetR/AcrR family transcriptional regulator [Lentibacillus cibarius]TMN21790.1 TetR/AcrR family transcriptional regulator [Lentibacillus cibarius]TRM10650.1 TetR/AcrR family transcriptional regulator [Lentibacillus cibarius]
MTKPNKWDSILSAANEVFLTYGYEKTKMQEIAVKAAVGKGTIYEYVDSKEDLFVQMIKTNVSYVSNILMETIEASHSIEAFFEQLLDKVLFILNKHCEKLSFVINEDLSRVSNQLQEWMVANQEKDMNRLTDMLQLFMDRGEIRNVKPEVAAWLIQDIFRLGFYFRIFRKQTNIEELMRAEIDILLKGLK